MPGKAQRKEDSVSLGDKALNASDAVEKEPSPKAVALELPKQPLPGQRTPNAKGRCPDEQVPINGGCWGKVALKADHCHGNLFVYEGGCYAPVYETVRKPTSAPQQR